MEYTTHAMQRCSQRGIRQQQVQWLVDFGCHTWNRGAQVYFFDRARLKRLLLKLSSAERQLAEKAQNVYVVVVDGAVVLGTEAPTSASASQALTTIDVDRSTKQLEPRQMTISG